MHIYLKETANTIQNKLYYSSVLIIIVTLLHRWRHLNMPAPSLLLQFINYSLSLVCTVHSAWQ